MKNRPNLIIIKIEELKKAEYNPRKINELELEKLKQSIENFGIVDPIIINNDNTIIGGHQRVRACEELNIKEVPAIQLNIDKKKEKALNLALNKISGSWDEELLMQLLYEIDEDLREFTGFEDKEINKYLDKMIEEDPEDDFNPESSKKPISKYGDLYKLGEHRLLCGDATKEEDIKTLMGGGGIAQMSFTDPPYNIDYQGGMNTHGQNKREGIKNDKMTKEQFKGFLTKSVRNIIDKTEGGIYICMSSVELDTLKSVFEYEGGHFQSFIIWAKNTFTLSRSDWQNQYEPILYGWPAKNKNHYFVGHRDEGNVWENLEKLKPKITEENKMEIKVGGFHITLDQPVTGKICRKKDCTDIWKEKKPTKSVEHPTMKPIKLVLKAIKASSKVDDIVLDPFGGSGSTLIACEKAKRKCYMSELDPKYIDIIIKRWEKLTGQKAKKLN